MHKIVKEAFSNALPTRLAMKRASICKVNTLLSQFYSLRFIIICDISQIRSLFRVFSCSDLSLKLSLLSATLETGAAMQFDVLIFHPYICSCYELSVQKTQSLALVSSQHKIEHAMMSVCVQFCDRTQYNA